MTQKFKPGDKVRVIIYGHLIYTTKQGYAEFSEAAAKIGYECDHMLLFGTPIKAPDTVVGKSKPDNIIFEYEHGWEYDINPELVGKEGIVTGSYHDLYGEQTDALDEIVRYQREYYLKGISGKRAWYDERQLELI